LINKGKYLRKIFKIHAIFCTLHHEVLKVPYNMIILNKFTLEFPLNASPRLLFTLISTAEGLARWFADRVEVRNNEFLFEWEGSSQSAKMVECKEGEYVKFEWTDDFHQGYLLELVINHQPVSGQVALIVTDYTEETDVDFSQMWWTTQVGRLQRLFNS
jgi:uncharacterized protein YndB with AHSA1/START domain